MIAEAEHTEPDGRTRRLSDDEVAGFTTLLRVKASSPGWSSIAIASEPSGMLSAKSFTRNVAAFLPARISNVPGSAS